MVERSGASFTGRGRRRRTRRAVVLGEQLARTLIAVGGIGTIAAVVLIFVFLLWVVFPLFAPASLEGAGSASAPRAEAPLLCGVDEYRALVWSLSPAGTAEVHRLPGGERLELRDIQAAGSSGSLPRIRSCARSVQGSEVALGFEDGTVRLGRIGFTTRYAESTERAELERVLGEAQRAPHGGAFLQRMPGGELRLTRFEAELEEPIESGSRRPILALDLVAGSSNSAIALLDDEGRVAIERVSRSENMITGEVTREVTRALVPFDRSKRAELPAFVRITGSMDSLLLVWLDGSALRYDIRDLDAPRLAEELDLAEGEARLSALSWSLGQSTLLAGDSLGRVHAWFGIKPAAAGTPDGVRFVRALELPRGETSVVAIAASARNRIAAIAHADGAVHVAHITSQNLLCDARVAPGWTPLALCITPKEDGLTLFAGQGVCSWDMRLEHPEAGLSALFTPVWYEGYEKPEHVWQSSSGTDDFEAKLGLMPLVFGTLKATFYSMLFGAPIALLAALFTSEFLHRRLRTPLKSVIELMASLPSVVLGFIAALVIAPAIQGRLAAVLALFLCVPLALLLGAYLWQLLPQKLSVRLSGAPRLLAIALAIPAGVLASSVLGPRIEDLLFAGDMVGWLDGRSGRGFGGWIFLLLPLSVLVVALFSGRFAGPWLRKRSMNWSRNEVARADLGRFCATAAAALLLTLLAAGALDGAGIDPRGGVFDTYVQRNALVVGFVMGFAVIPIVYTLAEDALSSVPQHLRHASLGAGATSWQTAVHVVLPTAMSGIFSALMIGLGRAVGETMIVLMATGNTPVMSWNVFNGFRTLSANIAFELPEAVRNSTHYRTLFLAALCLFGFTFVFNTLAELVRQRFRRRAVQL